MLTILKEEEIAGLLNTLSLDELEGFRTVLKNALHEYSTGTQVAAGKSGKAGTSDIQQPARTCITSPVTGRETIFMPACSADGIGMKVVTLAKKEEPATACGTHARPTGALTLYSEAGSPIGILHADTLTAFRTALASACLLLRRDSVRNITVFGCGEQAYWHVRLALLLRGASIRHVNVITRRFDSARSFLARLHQLPAALKAREGWTTGNDKSATKFSILTSGYNDYGRLMNDHLLSSDVIFCCTPATEPLFDASALTSHEGRRKGRLIVAVGSSTQQMREVPADLLRQATNMKRDAAGEVHKSSGSNMHYHKHAVEGGVIVVDTLDGALKEAGEIVEAGLTPRHLVELGELVMLSRCVLDSEDDAEDTSSLSTSSTGLSGGSAAETGATTPTVPASPGASNSNPPTSQFEKFSLNGPAMATVYGDATPGPPTPTIITTSHPESSDTADGHRKSSRPFSGFFGGGGSSSRSSSPARKDSGGSSSHHRTESPARKTSGGGGGTGLLSSFAPRSHHRRSSSSASVDRRKKKEDQSARWLQRGNVIYKSVGLGLMDLSVGLHLIDFAHEKGVGTRVDGF
ncbi:hypothetical protein F503_00103 [Ophiostoma piceae UAMH 11346]|uniref:Ornithine cyclodeaminase mu-crystallin family protein n=1 Tax=Ophiostoma piceae (strain UAMH 11346) TaxID=1262450 RepID=S3BUM1_OPHP1|nr:hypothetical protein F503_00103 [Ophiostoma piceae UAMH 11346]